MLQRLRYLEKIRPYYDNYRIKLITGIRQSGKSVLMRQMRDELEAQEKKVVYLDFSDATVARECMDVRRIPGYIGSRWKKRGKKRKCYVFLDSVQKIPNWSLACQILLLSKMSVFVAGNGAPLLTPEAERDLSGNYVEFHVRPFVYKELRDYADELGREVSVNDYVQYGGFPKRIEYDDREEMLRYLDGVGVDAVRDAIGGCKIQREAVFQSMADFLMTSIGKAPSANAVHARLKEEGLTCSINTVMKYMDYMETAGIIHRVPFYSARTGGKLESRAKIYAGDVAFHTVRMPQDADLAYNMENVVYNELVNMGYTLSAYAHKGGDVSFLAEKNGREYLVQVAERVAKKRVREKEFRPLNKLDNARKKILITTDEKDYSTSTVEHIRLKDFLMMEDLRGTSV